MSDSQPPNPRAPSFEVPDLELEPVPRTVHQAAPRPNAPAPRQTAASAQAQLFGSSFDFGDELDDLEFERSAQPSVQLAGEHAARTASATRAKPAAADAGPSWPSGRAPTAAELVIDPHELSILSDYGDPPESAALTLGYAYRVFTRQRELKHQLIPIARECERAQLEREATLAEFSRALRPTIEHLLEFRRFFAPLSQLEQCAAERGQALRALTAKLGAESGLFEAGLAQLAGQRQAVQRLQREAQAQHDEREANAKRSQAKLKRLQIEMRALMNVAEQKLGPQAGQLPNPEAAQLASLQARAEALEPELRQTRAEFEVAAQTLTRLSAQLDTLSESELQIARQKQALAGAYQKELSLRNQGLSEAEIEQRAALADLARAILAAPGSVELPEAWLDRVRSVSQRADQLIVRAEMQRRAIAAYDAARARQGVQLACTAVGLVLLLFAFKLIF